MIDAIRIDDSKRVVLKRVVRVSAEVKLVQSLHTGDRSEDLDNHCIPILDYFDDMEDNALGLLIVSLPGKFDDPPFAFTSEVGDFVRQTLTVCIYHASINSPSI